MSTKGNETINLTGITQKKSEANLVVASIIAVVVFIAFFLPLLVVSTSPTTYILSSLAFVFIYAAMALSLNLEVGYIGLPNFGKVAFVAVGAYTFAILEEGGHNTPLINMLWAVVATAIFGIVITLPSLRLKEDYFAIVTIVAGEIVRIVVTNEERFGGFSGISVINPVFEKYSPDDKLGHIFISFRGYIFLLVFLAVLTTFGIHKTWDYAQSIGKRGKLKALQDVERYSVFLVILGFALNYIGFLDDSPSFGLDLLLLIFLAVIRFHIMVIEGGEDLSYYFTSIIVLATGTVLFVLRFFGDPRTDISTPQWYNTLLAFSALCIVYLVVQDIDSSPMGRTFRALREDDTSAISVGKGLLEYRLKNLIIASLLVGLVSPLFAFQLTSVTPFAFVPLLTFSLYTMLIIGGTGNNKGVIYGAVVVQLLTQATSKLNDLNLTYPWGTTARPSNWALIILGAALILFLIFGPEGVFPEKKYNNQKYYDLMQSYAQKDVTPSNPIIDLVERITKAEKVQKPQSVGDQVLHAENIHKYFGGVKALNGTTVSVKKGELTALIGPNGSGKSTFFNVITGFLQPELHSGEILFESMSIKGMPPHRIPRKGMVRTFQHTRNFPNMTVLENMLVSPFKQTGESIVWGFLYKSVWRHEEAKYVKKALEILNFLEISHVSDHLASELSGGQQKLLAIGRLLMTEPSLLLLDEPVAGVNPTLANKIFDQIISLKNNEGIDVLLIEHNMDVVMSFSDRIIVMADGRVIAEGDADTIQKDRKVLDAYLGESPDEA